MPDQQIDPNIAFYLTEEGQEQYAQQLAQSNAWTQSRMDQARVLATAFPNSDLAKSVNDYDAIVMKGQSLVDEVADAFGSPWYERVFGAAVGFTPQGRVAETIKDILPEGRLRTVAEFLTTWVPPFTMVNLIGKLPEIVSEENRMISVGVPFVKASVTSLMGGDVKMKELLPLTTQHRIEDYDAMIASAASNVGLKMDDFLGATINSLGDIKPGGGEASVADFTLVAQQVAALGGGLVGAPAAPVAIPIIKTFAPLVGAAGTWWATHVLRENVEESRKVQEQGLELQKQSLTIQQLMSDMLGKEKSNDVKPDAPAAKASELVTDRSSSSADTQDEAAGGQVTETQVKQALEEVKDGLNKAISAGSLSADKMDSLLAKYAPTLADAVKTAILSGMAGGAARAAVTNVLDSGANAPVEKVAVGGGGGGPGLIQKVYNKRKRIKRKKKGASKSTDGRIPSSKVGEKSGTASKVDRSVDANSKITRGRSSASAAKSSNNEGR